MASNGKNYGTVESLRVFQQTPAPQYVSASDVNFGPAGIVMPTPLMPSSMRFATPQANKMLNLPGVMSIYENRRNGQTF